VAVRVIADVRAGMLLVEAALGVGLLLLPAITAHGVPSAPLAWVLCCVIGTLVGYTVATARRAIDTDTPTMRAWYAAGTAVGQGFICWTAAAVLSGGNRPATFVAALALLLVSAVLAAALPAMSQRVKRVRLGLTVVVAVGWAVWPAAISVESQILGAQPDGILSAAFLLLISAVGWESSRTIVGPARPMVAVVLAGVVVTGVTAGLTAVHSLHGTGSAPPLAHGILVVAVPMLAVGYCMTNLRFAGRLAGLVAPNQKSRMVGVGMVCLVSITAMTVATATGSGTWQLLAGPGSMTCAIFVVVAARVLFDPVNPIMTRVVATVAGGLLCATALSTWPAMAFPLLTVAIVVSVSRLRAWRTVAAE
jgi:hypothetical protein